MPVHLHLLALTDQGKVIFSLSEGRSSLRSDVAITDASGNYRIEGLAPGQYRVRVGNDYWYPGVKSEEAATVITVAAYGAYEANVTLAEVSGFRISGRVSGLAAGLEQTPPVMLAPRDFSRVRHRQTPIGDDGAFLFEGVPAGEYYLSITAPHATPELVRVSNGDLAGIELRVPRLIPVQGTVTLEGAALPRDMSISFEGASEGWVPVSPDRTFQTALPEGEYRVTVSGLTDRMYVKALEADAIDLVAAPLEVKDRQTPTRLKLTVGVSNGVRVRGHVTGETGSLARSRLILSGAATSASMNAAISDDGAFEIPRMTPGAYRARVALGGGVASPPTLVVIPAEDVNDLRIAVPAPRAVFGDVVVQGNGPPPRFTLVLVRNSGRPIATAERPTALPVLSEMAFGRLEADARDGSRQVITLEIDATPDGNFSLTLPEGEYRVFMSPSTRMPAAYQLVSLTYGATDLFTDTLKIDAAPSPWLHAGFIATVADPWVRVSGRVSGLDAAPGGPYRVALTGGATSAIETPVNADGTFQFVRVLRDNAYTARLVPQVRNASTPRFNVAGKDVTDVEIVVSREVEITGRVIVAGGGQPPPFVLSVGIHGRVVGIPVKADLDGWFKARLPEDVMAPYIGNLPLGYELVSITYGGKNIRNSPVKLTGSETARLEIVFSREKMPHHDVRGRVRGLKPEYGASQLRLSGVSSSWMFDTPINTDGTFVFSEVPPGPYVASIVSVEPLALTPVLISVEFTADVSVDFIAQLEERRPVQTPVAVATSVGVKVRELGFSGSGSTAEDGAVANLRTINTAQVTFLSTNGGNYGSINALVNAGLLDTRFLGSFGGYTYSTIVQGADYIAAAVPTEPGRKAFFSTPDAVVRYATAEELAPDGQAGQPVQ
jgi:hypothetical protein